MDERLSIMTEPIVTIVLPTYNRAVLLSRAIKSVINQTYTDWELLVIDDASTDNTQAVLSDWAAKDSRIRVIRNEKNSYPDISKILNKGIELARGKYIARLDDDDYWRDEKKLTRQVEFLETHPDYVIVGSGMVIIDGEGRELYRYLKKEKDEEIRANALLANPFSHTTVVFRRDVARAVGGYDGSRYVEDWGLWLNLGKKGKMCNFPEYFTAYLVAGQNKSLLHQHASAKAILSIIWKHRKDYPGFMRGLSLNLLQYLYSFLPVFIRRQLHGTLSFLKRRFF